jgi:hypothetical protein
MSQQFINDLVFQRLLGAIHQRAWALLGLLALILSACGSQPVAVVVAIEVLPKSLSLKSGQSQVFTALVTGSENKAVQWSAGRGKLEPEGNSVRFTAPEGAGDVSLMATSLADGTKTATATVMVQAVNEVTAIVADSQSLTVKAGTTVPLKVSLAGLGDFDRNINWQLLSGEGKLAKTKSQSGEVVEFASTATPMTVQIKAESAANPQRNILIVIITREDDVVTGISATPTEATLKLGETLMVAASLKGIGQFNDELTWVASSGSLSKKQSRSGEGVIFTPASIGEAVITASSSANSSQKVSITIKIKEADAITALQMEPETKFLAYGMKVAFQATLVGTGDFDPNIQWSVSGGSLSQNSSKSGESLDYSAPTSGQNVTITAQSVQNSAIKAQKTISLLALPQLAAGDSHSLALLPGNMPNISSNTLNLWGQNDDGQLGDGSNNGRNRAASLAMPADLLGSVAGGRFSLLLGRRGEVWAFGSNSYGQLGDGTNTRRFSPQQVLSLEAVALAAGGAHSLALARDGRVYGWGWNDNGQVGDGSLLNRSKPVLVANISDVTALAAGGVHSLALKTDGSLWAWGQNDDGQLGDESSERRVQPVKVKLAGQVRAMAAGGYHSLALDNAGQVWAWGWNEDGQLGLGNRERQTLPSKIAGLDDVVAISAGTTHSLALKSDGSLWAWGWNRDGQLGTGGEMNSLTPTRITLLTKVVEIAAGGYHSLARKSDGSLWAWGWNRDGQLGDGRFENQRFPQAVLPALPPTMTGSLQSPNMTGSLQSLTNNNNSNNNKITDTVIRRLFR